MFKDRLQSYLKHRYPAIVLLIIAIGAIYGCFQRIPSAKEMKRDFCCAKMTDIEFTRGWIKDELKLSGTSDIPNSVLSQYFVNRIIPSCPSGGKYWIGSIEEALRCTIHGVAKDAYDIHWAAFYGDTNRLASLVSQGVDLNTPSFCDQWTPLHYAAFAEKTNVITFLLERGADPRKVTRYGKTPSDLTTNIAILRILESKR